MPRTFGGQMALEKPRIDAETFTGGLRAANVDSSAFPALDSLSPAQLAKAQELARQLLRLCQLCRRKTIKSGKSGRVDICRPQATGKCFSVNSWFLERHLPPESARHSYSPSPI